MRILLHHLFLSAKNTCQPFRRLTLPRQMARATIAKLEVTPLAQKMPQIYSKFLEIKQTPEIAFLDQIFTKAGFEFRMAGGAVRDLLTGVMPSDIDFATTATPIQMEKVMCAYPNEIRMIVTKAGMMHGTITARVNDKANYEITTLRIDKNTDGRHAEVEFITDWKLDASRRDLTINAMFLDLQGNLIDYYGGLDDLAKKRIVFVGDPNERITEDYLRILRYFRFYIRYGSLVQHDEHTIKAIINNKDGLSGISGERIWSEMKKILSYANCDSVMPVMLNQCKIGLFMGLTNDPVDLTEFNTAHKNLLMEKPVPNFNPATLMVSLVSDDEELAKLNSRLKLSNQESLIMEFILNNRAKKDSVNLTTLQRAIALSPPTDQRKFMDSTLEFLKYIGQHDLKDQLEVWPIPKFPVSGYDLRSKVSNPRNIGIIVDYLKQIWAKSEFTLSQEQIDTGVDEALDKIAKGELGAKKKTKGSR